MGAILKKKKDALLLLAIVMKNTLGDWGREIIRNNNKNLLRMMYDSVSLQSRVNATLTYI